MALVMLGGQKSTQLSHKHLNLVLSRLKLLLKSWKDIDQSFTANSICRRNYWDLCEFNRNRSTTYQIFYIRQILNKKWQYKGREHLLFRESEKAHESVNREQCTIFSLNLAYLW